MEVVYVHQCPPLIPLVAALLNKQWPRSEQTRIASLEKSTEGLPLHLALILVPEEQPAPLEGQSTIQSGQLTTLEGHATTQESRSTSLAEQSTKHERQNTPSKTTTHNGQFTTHENIGQFTTHDNIGQSTNLDGQPTQSKSTIPEGQSTTQEGQSTNQGQSTIPQEQSTTQGQSTTQEGQSTTQELQSTILFGCSSLAKVVDPTISNSVLIENVLVDPEKRAKGYGRTLMEKTESVAVKLGYTTAYLSTTDKEQFYAHLGYELCDPVTTGSGAETLLSADRMSGIMHLFGSSAMKKGPKVVWMKKSLSVVK
eukprot:Phypoly_transcript_14668.p1 GENE.Phypoly_transcript_14668~~Phypoly_transcript_14668.p1  ORF type:complete len:322 (+),score=53.42 Phypoly_transcript_14668:35-967(+)